MAARHRVMLLYWGRRGSLPRFTLEAARAAKADPSLDVTVSVSRQVENFAEFAEFGDVLFAVDTFASASGAVTGALRLPSLRRALAARLVRDRTEAVIELMPHVWSPFMVGPIRRAGVRYAPIIHDATAHPGDRTALVNRLLDRVTIDADTVLTLSDAVAERLVLSGRVARSRLATVFHPDLSYGAHAARLPPGPAEPIRVLFLGRVLAYKGLPLMLDAVDVLRARGERVEVMLYGDGALGASAPRLAALGADVHNHWLSESEIADALARAHVVCLSYVEASQSGVAAAALGAGVPVVATPVGGLAGQVRDGETGIMAARVDAAALADALAGLCRDPAAYAGIVSSIARTRETRSMARFVAACVSHVLERPS